MNPAVTQLLSVTYIYSGISAAINKYLCCVDSQKLRRARKKKQSSQIIALLQDFFFFWTPAWGMQFKVFQKEELSAGFVEDYF